ncbi:hypothetical protein K432DRAFT_289402 [Lepidopterella palustris CBS 459.81]|uniref:protein-tyrosine-phosphatase n=1 Tax=Lepidopterella palustris CBS 459.81 TaxID=1314670 RepID=A0A8E2JIY2_9PEZI|nr:hypothetical protein K432DRAFT_289402 [Lepidopterella palustris CBS 459.81]
MDSSSMTEPSPGPSPESPHAKMIPSSFVADFRPRRLETGSMEPQANFFELQRPTTPAKKPRNLKNLAVNTSSLLNTSRAASTASLPLVAKKETTSSAPNSPSFVKPPTPPKRRPSNLGLTIQTPANDSKPMRLVIPSTPSFNRPTLRHFQSSPSLPMCSPSVAPSGGMHFPSLRPLKTNPHGFAEVPIEVEEEEDQEPNFDIPQSREEKPAAYPNGPIRIYESGVYLYFEPTAEQAANYDVILNVASEVKNPFVASSSTNQDSLQDLEARRRDGKPITNTGPIALDYAAIPGLTREKSNDTQNSSPTTPKATPVSEMTTKFENVTNALPIKTPEYIHIPWEHNTDIVPDLYKLVQVIDERVQQGKRVLVHCQCGVSRSASLIVAYGLFKNPGISVQEAYDAVKKRSKWIGPNMNLIMQLQEFRNGLLRANGDRAFHNQVYGLALPRNSAGLPSASSSGNPRRSPFEMDTPSGSRTPRTAPLPPENDPALQRASTGNMISISPGPLTAPTGVFFSPGFRRSWGSSQTNYDLSPASATPYVDPKGHVVPVVAVTQNKLAPPQPSQRTEQRAHLEQQAEWKTLPVPNFSRQLPFKKQKEHDNDQHMTGNSPSITSPRSAEFHMAPFKEDRFDDSFGLLSPRAAEFNLPAPFIPPQDHSNEAGSHRSFDLVSPTTTEFPRDFTTNEEGPMALEVASPRSVEFHMTPLVPRVADEDPFGLTSPRRFEFPGEAFTGTAFERNNEAEIHGIFPHRHAHPIHPPSNLLQPENFNGFASLNSSAHSHPSIPALAPPPNFKLSSPPASRMDSLGSSPEPQPSIVQSIEAPLEAVAPEARSQIHLTTPPKQNKLRTRFSSPNMHEQRHLHKLQTEIESLLPPRSPNLPPAVDDLDALMSPRASEFTMNPFHIDLGLPSADASPASSNETIKEGDQREWKDNSDIWTAPKPIDEDPRSPVQKGVSPIVRNIWDVL